MNPGAPNSGFPNASTQLNRRNVVWYTNEGQSQQPLFVFTRAEYTTDQVAYFRDEEIYFWVMNYTNVIYQVQGPVVPTPPQQAETELVPHEHFVLPPHMSPPRILPEVGLDVWMDMLTTYEHLNGDQELPLGPPQQAEAPLPRAEDSVRPLEPPLNIYDLLSPLEPGLVEPSEFNNTDNLFTVPQVNNSWAVPPVDPAPMFTEPAAEATSVVAAAEERNEEADCYIVDDTKLSKVKVKKQDEAGIGRSTKARIRPNRKNHNESERRRREKLNERIDQLREIVPGCKCKKIDKASLLEETCSYLKSLQNKVDELVRLRSGCCNTGMSTGTSTATGTGMGMNPPMVPFPGPALENPANTAAHFPTDADMHARCYHFPCHTGYFPAEACYTLHSCMPSINRNFSS